MTSIGGPNSRILHSRLYLTSPINVPDNTDDSLERFVYGFVNCIAIPVYRV